MKYTEKQTTQRFWASFCRPKTDKNRQTDGSLLGTEQAHSAVSREALF